jgi:hypothetical protein
VHHQGHASRQAEAVEPRRRDRYGGVQAVLITSMLSISGQVLNIMLLKRAVSYRIAWRLVIPGLIGIPFGTAVLMPVDRGPRQ